jgi:nucleoside-diphosphate-sugar epimerase
MTTLPSRILVTGGAGFVGANLCLALAERSPGSEVIALDSLKRLGAQPRPPAQGRRHVRARGRARAR